MDIKARLKRTFVLCLIGLAIGGAIAAYGILKGEPGTRSADNGGVAGLKIGGPFSLIDQDGHKVTEKVFEKTYTLLYFGFTYCPAVCPTELQKISRALKAVEKDAPDIAASVTPVFISIDPERDTPAVVKDYISSFHPRLKGFTGNPEQIEAVKKLYRVYAVKVQTEGMTDYTMDHSSFIYLLSPSGEVLGIYRIADTADTIAQDIEKLVKPRV